VIIADANYIGREELQVLRKAPKTKDSQGNQYSVKVQKKLTSSVLG
jgi:hypothetical protein